jgi:hypothetical protein
MAFPTDWLYRKSITLSRASGAVTNYQMKLLVGESSGATGEDVDCGGLCKTDFSDLRFTAADGTTLLDYWIESVSGATPNQLATVWIEFDSIGTGATTFYMYYGNAAATAASNGPNTFPFFDHFDGASLDLTKWTDHGPGGSHSFAQSGSVLTITSVSESDYAFLDTDIAFGVNYAFRSRSNIDATGTTGIKQKNCWWNASGDSPDKFLGFACGYPYAGYVGLRTLQTTGQENQVNLSNAYAGYHIFESIRNGSTNVIYQIDGTTVATVTAQVPSGDNKPAFIAYGISSVVLSDWALVRQYAATEPAWGSWGSQEALGGGSVMNSHFFVMLLAGGGR